jgi:hypothetical protein
MPHSSGFARVWHARQRDQQIRINRILDGSPLASAGIARRHGLTLRRWN